jgi:hypothetical protein
MPQAYELTDLAYEAYLKEQQELDREYHECEFCSAELTDEDESPKICNSCLRAFS